MLLGENICSLEYCEMVLCARLWCWWCWWELVVVVGVGGGGDGGGKSRGSFRSG